MTATAVPAPWRALPRLLRRPRFRALFAVRLTSQLSDGVLQVALASYLLFSPERQPDAPAIAAALAAVLLPFSLLGPFVGVFLDRWSRRSVLVFANAVRALPVVAVAGLVGPGGGVLAVFGLVLMAFSVNRFFLAGLSAALPHVVEPEELVLANSVTPTSGTLAFLAGLGVATAARPALPGGSADAVLVSTAAAGYVAASLVALRLPRRSLGPDLAGAPPAVRHELRGVVRGLTSAVRHLRQRRPAADALIVIAAHRFCYGLSTVATILLYRNYFHPPGDTDAALAGLATAVLVSGAGFLAAALVTPLAARRSGTRAWMTALLAMAAGVEVMPGALYTELAILVAAFALGLSAQGVKICVDTLVQTHVDDVYRGRVFSLYDVVFNVAFVAAAAVAALAVPASGKSYAVVGLISAGYAATAWWYRRVAG